jgi:hypothetical protein
MKRFPEGSITFVSLLATALVCLGVGYASSAPPLDPKDRDEYWNKRWIFYKEAERDYYRMVWEFEDKWRKMTIGEIEAMKTKDRDSAFNFYYLNMYRTAQENKNKGEK